MKKIYLVAGSRIQKGSPAPARELYQGDLFKYGLRYAEMLGRDNVFILSPKYGVIRPDDIIKPYQDTISTSVPKRAAQQQGVRVMSARDRAAWRARAARQLSETAKLDQDVFVVLAGRYFVEHLRLFIAHIEEPLKGHSYDTRLLALQRKLMEEEHRRGGKWGVPQASSLTDMVSRKQLRGSIHFHMPVLLERWFDLWCRWVQSRPHKISLTFQHCFVTKKREDSVHPGQESLTVPSTRQKRIALVCGGIRQKDVPAPARDLYLSEPFRFGLLYAEKLKVDKIFVLSSKHGAVEPNQIIEPYNLTVQKRGRLSSKIRANVQSMNEDEKGAWANMVATQLSLFARLGEDKFIIILGGKRHRFLLRPLITYLEHPKEDFEREWQAYCLQQQKAESEASAHSLHLIDTELNSAI